MWPFSSAFLPAVFVFVINNFYNDRKYDWQSNVVAFVAAVVVVIVAVVVVVYFRKCEFYECYYSF